MADETELQDAPETAAEAQVESPSDQDDAASESEAPTSAASTVEAKSAEFPSFKPTPSRGTGGPIDRFLDVHVSVWAELGRVEVPLGDLVKLDEGSVILLNRPVSDPVDLVSQGVKLARGEVIVVDDCFAIRIKEIVSNNKS